MGNSTSSLSLSLRLKLISRLAGGYFYIYIYIYINRDYSVKKGTHNDIRRGISGERFDSNIFSRLFFKNN